MQFSFASPDRQAAPDPTQVPVSGLRPDPHQLTDRAADLGEQSGIRSPLVPHHGHQTGVPKPPACRGSDRDRDVKTRIGVVAGATYVVEIGAGQETHRHGGRMVDSHHGDSPDAPDVGQQALPGQLIGPPQGGGGERGFQVFAGDAGRVEDGLRFHLPGGSDPGGFRPG